MAITFSAPTSTVVAATSVTVTTPTAPGGGSLNTSNVIFALVGTGGSASEWTGAAAAGWTSVLYEATGPTRLHVLWRQATASEPANYTLGAYTASAVDYGIMFSCAGIDTANPVHLSASDGANANNVSLISPAVSPTITDAMLFWAGFGRGNAITTLTTASSSGTELYDVNGGTTDAARGVIAGYYEQLSASGSTGTRTTTLTQSSGSRAMVTLALNPASVATMTQSAGMVPLN